MSAPFIQREPNIMQTWWFNCVQQEGSIWGNKREACGTSQSADRCTVDYNFPAKHCLPSCELTLILSLVKTLNILKRIQRRFLPRKAHPCFSIRKRQNGDGGWRWWFWRWSGHSGTPQTGDSWTIWAQDDTAQKPHACTRRLGNLQWFPAVLFYQTSNFRKDLKWTPWIPVAEEVCPGAVEMGRSSGWSPYLPAHKNIPLLIYF